MAGVYDGSGVTTKVTVSHNADVSVCCPSSETFHLSIERLDTLRGMADEMDRKFKREQDEMDRKFTRENDEMDRRFTREHNDLTRRFTREHDDLTRRFTREHDDLTRRIKDLEWEIKDLVRADSHCRTHGEKTDLMKVGHTHPQAHGPAFGQPQAGISPPSASELVAPLQVSENRLGWDRKAFASTDPHAPEVVVLEIKGLLNKLTMENFDSISDQIIQRTNRSENQKDGRTLNQVVRIVFEKAIDEPSWSEMYARLCRKMMEQISTNVHDEGIKTSEGKPIAGGQLLRKYLLNRCQEDFERGWVAKEAASIGDANERNGSGEVALYSDDYYIAQKAKRQGLGLIKFIGELFKVQMLTERIMHECMKKFLSNVHDPEEEEIESLCTLMKTVGFLLDTQRYRAHMDVYFQRMKALTQNPIVSPGMQLMLQDVLELRERKWVARNALTQHITLEQPQRRKHNLPPRTEPLAHPAEESDTPSEEEGPALDEMDEKSAGAKIKEDVKELFNVRNLDEAEIYFSRLPSQYHLSLVNKLVSSAVESMEPDARLVANHAGEEKGFVFS